MTSKWVKEVMESVEDMNDRETLSLLERIDRLLKRTMHHLDDDNLYEKILEETKNVPDRTD